eukprot:TRINITY_DN4283_c0_g1_i3.p2 TRINITY_DN4283_c0_g1~~TRINITY_DN4283_c0_g1_i3.p2  ORF type:complete len:170 (+),score=53.05 TRINITY_DN4283_c0_g1_i3:87-596(+)
MLSLRAFVAFGLTAGAAAVSLGHPHRHHFEHVQQVTREWFPEFNADQAGDALKDALAVMESEDARDRITAALNEVDGRDIADDTVRDIARAAACQSISEGLLKPIFAKYGLGHEKTVDAAIDKLSTAVADKPELGLDDKLKLLSELMGGSESITERKARAMEIIKEDED